MRENRYTDIDRLKHILEAIEHVESYIYQSNYKELEIDAPKRFGTIKLLENIGEASYHLSKNLKTENPQIPWAKMIGFRHIAVHEYADINMSVVWHVAREALEPLKPEIQKIISNLESTTNPNA
jgi:uncharacterized protein with HEPN domain